MRILNIAPAAPSGSGRFPCVAVFDAEIGGNVRLYNLRLLRSPDGRHLTYAPSAHGKRCATFAPELAEQLSAAATAALGGRAANGGR
jgi:hypothetical protein